MSATFTKELKENYKKAIIENIKQTKVYNCVSSKGKIIQRNLDLTNDFVFCDEIHKNNEPKTNSIKEYKLEAFMIKKALENEKWLLPINGKEWRLLDAERKFAKEDVSKKGKGQRLDILAFEEKTKSYIILELKANENRRDFSTANKELECYTDTIKNHINAANDVYSVDAKNVKGYIVWNAKEKSRKIDNQWGIIEYAFDVLDKDIDNLEFSIITEPIK